MNGHAPRHFVLVTMFRRELPHTTLGDYFLIFDLDSYKTSELIKSVRMSTNQITYVTGREAITGFDDWCPIILPSGVIHESFDASEIPTCLTPVTVVKPWNTIRTFRAREALVKESVMNVGPLTFWWCMRLQQGDDHYYETPRLRITLLTKGE